MDKRDNSGTPKSPAKQRVYYGRKPYSLIHSGNLQKYYQLLCNFEFLSGKIQHPEFGVQTLIEDYDLLDDPEATMHPDYDPEVVKAMRLIQGALQLSAHVLVEKPTQLASQLWGRLQSFDMQEVQSLLQQAEQNQTAWLRPLKSNLIPPGGRLLRILTGHSDSVNAIAITQDSKQVVSGSEDGVLKVWDLETGKQPLTLTGHTQLITAITLSPDNKRVISSSEDGTLRVWDLTNGEELFALAEQGYIARALAVTSDSNWVISVGRNETKEMGNRSIWHNCITLWNLKTAKHIFTEEIILNAHPRDGIKLADAVALSSDGAKVIFCYSFRGRRRKYNIFKLKNLKGWHEILNVQNREAKLNPDYHITWIKTKLLEQTNQEHVTSITSDHNDKIMTVAVTPDGKQAITGSKDNTLIVWDLETKEQKSRLMGHSDAITAVAITSDSTQAVSSSKDETVKTWNLKTGKEISTFTDFNNLINSIAITPDGKHIISGSREKVLKFWIFNHNNFKICKLKKNHSRPLTETEDFTIILLTFLLIGVLPFLTTFILLICILLFVFNKNQVKNNSFGLLKASNKNQLVDLNKHNDSVTTTIVTLDGNQVISGSKDNTIKIWNLQTGKQLHSMTGHRDTVSSLATIPKSKHIVSGSHDKTLKIWNIKNFNEVFCLKSWSEIVYECFSLIVSAFLFLSYFIIIIYWFLYLWMSFIKGNISYLEMHMFQIFVLNVSVLGIFAVFSILDFVSKNNCNQISRVTITSDGNKAISASINQTLEVWNLTEQKQLFVLRGHRDWITSIALISDDYLISGSKDKMLKVWNLRTRKELFTLTGHSSPVTAVAVTPDGSRAISGSSDSSLKVWDLESRKAILTINGHRDSVEAIAITPNGKHLVSASSDHTLRVWDLLTGEEITSFTADSPLTCCTVAPEGAMIVAGDQVGQLHFLHLEGTGAWP